ncbi:MAG TPA: DPP IV N-terminal domain-containing protein [Saprospiraceae bacterium]|nr:DPP IV N-terminal domain-containing protein [Saprospiraceae bacterium]
MNSLVSSQKRNLTLEEIYQQKKIKEEEIIGFKFMNDGFSFSRLVNNKIIRFNIENRALIDTIFDGDNILDARIRDRISDYLFSDDEQKILLICAKEQIYRHSFISEVWVYDLKKRLVFRVHPKGKIKYPSFNASGDKIAFVLENDIYYQDLNNGSVVRVTHDGCTNKIINGSSDWVYEEEFTLTRAYEWSPNGDQILYLKFDESKVEEVYIDYFEEDLYPHRKSLKYPKVGSKISLVTAWNFNLKKNKATSLNFDNWVLGDYYLPRIQWLPDNQRVCLTLLNRPQNKLDLLISNVSDGKTSLLFNRISDSYIQLANPLYFSPDLKFFLMRDNRDGYSQLYKYDLDGKLIGQLTFGNNEITNILHTNFLTNMIFFQRSENLGIERKIYKLNLNGNELNCLTPKSGFHEAIIGKNNNCILVTNSDFNVPPQYNILDLDGNYIYHVEGNEHLINAMQEFNISEVEHQLISNRNGDLLNSMMIKPSNFDPDKKYPVLMYVYGAPGKQEVLNKWNSFRYYWWFQLLAQHGYLIFIVDNRGTPGRGDLFQKVSYKQLGKYELEDQIDAVGFLNTKSYVDASRIGIFGWSYGGYMSTLCIFKHSDIFKVSIAGAPVSNWQWYNCVYTERYMGSVSNNKQSYLDNSPVYFTNGLKGAYLLIHGLADDNVHFQHSAELVNSLVKNNKQFESFFYPNSKHTIANGQAAFHLFTKMTQFIYEKL